MKAPTPNRSLILSLCVAAGALLLYGFSVGFDFLAVDDASYILENPHVNTGLTLENVSWAFRLSTINDTCYYMPVTWMTFMADASLWGLSPAGYHAVNVLGFALTGVLLFSLFLRVTRSRAVSFVAAALFCVHPMRVESVVWVAERKDVLSGLFLLSALFLWTSYLERKKTVYYVAALGAFVLGFLSKPNVVVLPALLVIVEYLYRHFHEEPLPGFARALKNKIPFVALAAVGAAFTVATGSKILLDLPLPARLAVTAQAHYHYLSKTLLPWGLMLSERSYQFQEIKRPFPLFVLLALAGVTLVFGRLYKKHPWALLTWLWFLVALAPVNGFLPTGNILWSDKFTYLPHMGLMLGVSVLLHRLPFGKSPRLRWVAAGTVLCLWGAGTLAYAAKWRNTETYFDYVLGNGGPRGYSLLMIATSRRSRGDLEGALRALDESRRLEPGFVPTYFLRGTLMEDKGLLREAIADYETALRLSPRYYDVMVNLAGLYARTGDRAKAEGLLDEARRGEETGRR